MHAMAGKPLNHSEKKAIEALVSGANPSDAYVAGYPVACRWRPETVQAKADKLFSSDRAKEYIDSLDHQEAMEVFNDRKEQTQPGMDYLESQQDKLEDVKPDKLETKDKHPGGRPTKYKQEYNQMMLDYFNQEPYKDEVHENSKGDLKMVRVVVMLPTLVGFACKIGVTRETLHHWAHTKDENDSHIHPEFSDTYNRAKAYQEYILVANGLTGGYVPNFAIFTAKNIIGWRDSKDLSVSGPGGGPIKTQKITEDMSPEEAGRIYKESLGND